MYSCFAPKKIINKATGEEMYVDCRKCEYCRNKRAYELSQRIDREFLNPANKSALFVTLTYDNDHLPVYRLDKSDNIWYSNREDFDYADAFGYERYPRLEYNAVDRYYNPINMDCDDIVEDYTWFEQIVTNVHTSEFEVIKVPQKIRERKEKAELFGHLCYIDILKFLTTFRKTLYRDFKLNRKDLEYKHFLDDEQIKNRNYINTYFKGVTYEDIKFRYFLCGEYGPVTHRPHYHCVLWFSQEFNEYQRRYINKVIRSCWPSGNVDTKPVTFTGINNYVSSYVVSSANLPRILQKRHLRPFVCFSKNPSIGYYEVDDDAIQKVLVTGTFEYRKYDSAKKEFVDVSVSPTFYHRYFPRCNAFGYGTDKGKLAVYRYVTDYFKFKKVTHSASEVDDIKLMDIDWSPLPFADGIYQDWRYLDKYASLVCYRYCVKFGMTPEQVLLSFENIYSKLEISNLNRFYSDCEELSANDYCVYSFNINHDRDFLDNLPQDVHSLTDTQIFALENYGIEIEFLYPDEILNLENRDRYDIISDARFHEHKSKHKTKAEKMVKSKKLNSYKSKFNKDTNF